MHLRRKLTGDHHPTEDAQVRHPLGRRWRLRDRLRDVVWVAALYDLTVPHAIGTREGQPDVASSWVSSR